MKVDEVLACSFPHWYPEFSKITIRSEVIPVPDEVLAYLRSNSSVVLPKECENNCKPSNRKTDDDDNEDMERSAFEDDDENGDEGEVPHFPEFSKTIGKAIDRLGGSVFCKLNWSAPRDATWVAYGNSLMCKSLSDVYLLLKSSDFIRHDLCQPFKACDDSEGSEESLKTLKYSLVIRRWTEINPGHEFRCFVKDKVIVGISQRDGTHFYKHMADERSSILRDIQTFFQEHIRSKFELNSFVMDVVRSAKDTVQLVDLNPFGWSTDSILFDWDELLAWQNKNEDDVDFRVVETDSGIQPNGLRHYSMPRDFIDLASGTDADKLVDFLKLQKAQQEQE